MAALKDIDHVLKRLERQIPEIRRRGLLRLAKRVGHDMIDAMPVKTGRLANNWVASENPTGSGLYNRTAKGNYTTAKFRFDRTIERLKKRRLNNIVLSNATPYGGYALLRSGRNVDATFDQSALLNLDRLKKEFIDEINRLKK